VKEKKERKKKKKKESPIFLRQNPPPSAPVAAVRRSRVRREIRCPRLGGRVVVDVIWRRRRNAVARSPRWCVSPVVVVVVGRRRSVKAKHRGRPLERGTADGGEERGNMKEV